MRELHWYLSKNRAQKKRASIYEARFSIYLTLYYNLEDSTRRFWIRPSSVSLEAIGFASP
jgi:hypothetical protein